MKIKEKLKFDDDLDVYTYLYKGNDLITTEGHRITLDGSKNPLLRYKNNGIYKVLNMTDLSKFEYVFTKEVPWYVIWETKPTAELLVIFNNTLAIANGISKNTGYITITTMDGYKHLIDPKILKVVPKEKVKKLYKSVSRLGNNLP